MQGIYLNPIMCTQLQVALQLEKALLSDYRDWLPKQAIQ